ncbi:MAG TPA: ATP-binding protein, partial [Vicinamibacterales bacterium]|nr:ATP-binding protein [Vicinamibacterales bacterium]
MTDRRHAIDLATGAAVSMIVSSTDGGDEHARWVSRCDALYDVHAFAADNLVDFGRCGASHRFEAWRRVCEPPREPLAVTAIRHVERRVEAALAELFEQPGLSSRAVCVFGPPGCGKTRLLHRLARVARTQGFVPLAIDLLDSPLSELIDGRSVCLIDDERAGGAGALAYLALRSPRAHVVLRAAVDDATDVPSVSLTALSASALMSSIVDAPSATATVLRRAAVRAVGNPRRFINLINSRQYARRDTVSGNSRAAEQAPVYGTAPAATPVAWPIPAEVTALRRQVQEGTRHLEEGRHAPGERDLR